MRLEVGIRRIAVRAKEVGAIEAEKFDRIEGEKTCRASGVGWWLGEGNIRLRVTLR